jgi:hypothetical protein
MFPDPGLTLRVGWVKSAKVIASICLPHCTLQFFFCITEIMIQRENSRAIQELIK